MAPEFALKWAIAPALSLLPERMNTPAAIAMLLCIGLQESRFEYRLQVGGPARSFWQMELGGGVRGVLTHQASKAHIQAVLSALSYDPTSSAEDCWTAIKHNDVLGAAFARLLLWTLPQPLPTQVEVEEGWEQYVAAWRPGRHRRDSWDAFYRQAWTLTAP